MYNSMSYQLNRNSAPIFTSACLHADKTSSISIALDNASGGRTYVSFNGTIAQLELIRAAIEAGIADIRKQESLPTTAEMAAEGYGDGLGSNPR